MSFWTNKSAIVTGGSSGLGLAIAGALVEAGANVAIVARSTDKLESAATQLRPRGAGKVLSVAADITQADDVKRMIDTTLTEFGKLDLLVNCAGSSARGAIVDTPLDSFRHLMELNFFALVDCTKVCASALTKFEGICGKYRFARIQECVAVYGGLCGQ